VATTLNFVAPTLNPRLVTTLCIREASSSIHGLADLSFKLDSARHSLYGARQIGKFLTYIVLLPLRRVVVRDGCPYTSYTAYQ
jgi:hypothetical protein